MLMIDILNVFNEKQRQDVQILTCFNAIGGKIQSYGGYVGSFLGFWQPC